MSLVSTDPCSMEHGCPGTSGGASAEDVVTLGLFMLASRIFLSPTFQLRR